MAEKPSTLSLHAQYDDLLRLSAPLINQDDNLIAFLHQIKEHLTEVKKENQNLKSENKHLMSKLSESKNENINLETKLMHTQYMLDETNQKRNKLMAEKTSLEKQLQIIKEVLLVEQSALNEETREKLAFLDGKETRDETVNESDTTLLSSFDSFDQTDEDIDNLTDTQLNTDSVIDTRNIKRRNSKSGTRKSGGRKSGGRKSDGKRRSSQRHKRKSKPTDNSELLSSAREDESDSDAKIPRKVPPKRYCSDPSLACFKDSDFAQKADFSFESGPFSPFDEKKRARMSLSVLETSRMSLGKKERKHYFVTKTIIRTETCTYCNQKIKFYKPAVKCQDCRITCHPECRINVKSSCSRTFETPTRKTSHKVSLTDFTYHTSPMIPELITQCTNLIESRGLSEPGIYRVSGSEKTVRELKSKLFGGKGSQCLVTVDVHAVCSLVKDFFRSLNEPLVTRALWKEFQRATESPTADQRIQVCLNIIDQLPRPNKDTLAFMVLHLHRVAKSAICKMPINNLAKIFGPTIVGYSTDDPSDDDALSETGYQFKVMELILKIPLEYWNKILQDDSENDTVFSMSTPEIEPTFRREKSFLGSLTSKGKSAKRAVAVHLGRTALTPRIGSANSAKKTKKFFESPLLK